MKSALAWLLIISLGVNGYLWWRLSSMLVSENEPVESPNLAQAQSVTTLSPSFGRSSAINASADGDPITFSESDISLSLPAEGVSLAFLHRLQAAKHYEALSFHVRAYLRQHPQDIDALLLEAEAYYYTQPLNSALVNYYNLRDALITDEQLAHINQLIDVNTTRIIQQFSGDGSWDLLASFLEPLIQVDPLNRRYLMALAKAYGMQQQTVLMESVLAALPTNDTRAQRLRESMYAASEPQDQTEMTAGKHGLANSSYTKTSSNDVYLIERNGQYYTQVLLTGIEAELLIDTGASTTAVSQQVFDRIALNNTSYLGTFNVQTAGGNIASPIYKLSTLKVGSTTLNNVSVMVLPTEHMRSFDGLLGMNVIRRFNMSFDESAGAMRMYKKTQ